jgi:hypothetical protein
VSTALEPYAGPQPNGIVRYLGSGVAVDIRLDTGRGRARVAQYAMRMAASEHAVSARLYGVEADGTANDLGAIDVGPHSTTRALVPLPRAERARYEHVYLELVGQDLHLLVEAPHLIGARPNRLLRTAVALAAVTVGAIGGAALTFALPQTPAFAVPSSAIAGALVRVPYTTHGIGSWSYLARADDGSELGGGPLPRARGEIAFALPPNIANEKVTVLVRGRSMFGLREHEASFSVTPAPVLTMAAPVARIGAFTARRERLGDVETILASYLAVGNGGQLSIVDPNGKLVARAAFTHTGTQRVTLPASVARAALSVRLDVRRGASLASAAVGLPAALPGLVAPRVPQIADAGGPLVATPRAADALPEAVTPADDRSTAAGDPFIVVGTPRAGEALRLAIHRNFPGMQIRLEDDAGTVLDQITVGAGTSAVALRLPGALVARTYYVNCTYGSENGEEVVVRSIRVAAR